METHDFTLVIDGIDSLTTEVEDALYEAGCDDGLLSMSDRVFRIDFAREAPSLREAILSAIRDVESAGVGASVTRVEPDEIVNASEIARRLGISREAVRLYALGERGPGDFPSPIAGDRLNQRLWRWTDICDWIVRHKLPYDVDAGGASEIAVINAMLDLRRRVRSKSRIDQVWKELQRA